MERLTAVKAHEISERKGMLAQKQMIEVYTTIEDIAQSGVTEAQIPMRNDYAIEVTTLLREDGYNVSLIMNNQEAGNSLYLVSW